MLNVACFCINELRVLTSKCLLLLATPLIVYTEFDIRRWKWYSVHPSQIFEPPGKQGQPVRSDGQQQEVRDLPGSGDHGDPHHSRYSGWLRWGQFATSKFNRGGTRTYHSSHLQRKNVPRLQNQSRGENLFVINEYQLGKVVSKLDLWSGCGFENCLFYMLHWNCQSHARLIFWWMNRHLEVATFNSIFLEANILFFLLSTKFCERRTSRQNFCQYEIIIIFNRVTGFVAKYSPWPNKFQ